MRPPTKARPSRSALAVGAVVDANMAVISVMKSKLFIAIVLSCEKLDFNFESLDVVPGWLIHSFEKKSSTTFVQLMYCGPNT